MPKHILIVAGDPSGDQHGAALVRALKERHPDLKVSALGGSHLKAVADRFSFPLVGLGGFGFWEPILKLPKLFQARNIIKTLLKEDKPNAVIPIDYYGFNIHIARLARQSNIPVMYYISPQVWASRPHRIRELGRAVSKMLVIFPFEETLYQKAGVPARFVGHPLLDQIPEPATPPSTISIGLFPGSRWSVAERHLPVLIETAQELRKTFPQAGFFVFRPRELDASRYQPFFAAHPWLQLAYDPDFQKRKTLSLAISVSGTAALENALLGIPMIIMYKLSALTYAIAKQLIRVPFVGIPNLLANKAIVPELLQAEATPEKLSAKARQFLENPASLQRMREDLLALRQSLGQPGAVNRAAEEVASVL